MPKEPGEYNPFKAPVVPDGAAESRFKASSQPSEGDSSPKALADIEISEIRRTPGLTASQKKDLIQAVKENYGLVEREETKSTPSQPGPKGKIKQPGQQTGIHPSP